MRVWEQLVSVATLSVIVGGDLEKAAAIESEIARLVVGQEIQLHGQGSPVSRPGTLSYNLGRSFLGYNGQQDKGP